MVWLVLFQATQPDGRAALSQSIIADRLGVSSRHVRRALAELRKRRLIAVVWQGSLRRGVSQYVCQAPKVPPAVVNALRRHKRHSPEDTGVLRQTREARLRHTRTRVSATTV